MIPSLVLIYWHKQLRLHPYQIFACFLLMDTLYLYDFHQFYLVCPDNNLYLRLMNEVWPFSASGQDWEASQSKLRGMVFYSNLVLNEIVLVSLSILWIVFSIDLIRTI